MRVFGQDVDDRLRAAAISFLDALAASGTQLVRQDDLAAFRFEGEAVRLLATQQGIWKPRWLEAALSIRTVYMADPSKRPYDDEVGADGYLRYKWRGRDPEQADNRALRTAMAGQRPLIWFWGVDRGLYLPRYPVYLAEEEPDQQQFVVALDREALCLRQELSGTDPILVRDYAQRLVKTRLHQPLFRQRVLRVYEHQCAVCRLRHAPLLDAAHVIADSEGGEPVVTNGIAMCKLHHAAYDADIFGISPRYQIGVRHDVLRERDGPTLHALQAIEGSSIQLPNSRTAHPDTELLAVRWNRFQMVS